jgi:hypothetical protein
MVAANRIDDFSAWPRLQRQFRDEPRAGGTESRLVPLADQFRRSLRGPAFRGAGQKFRLALFQVGVSAPFLCVFPDKLSTLIQLGPLFYDSVELLRSEN